MDEVICAVCNLPIANEELRFKAWDLLPNNYTNHREFVHLHHVREAI